jgi:hypothetical protein
MTGTPRFSATRSAIRWAFAIAALTWLLASDLSFGFWDPLETRVLERWAAHPSADAIGRSGPGALQRWLTSASIHSFGLREFAGRLPSVFGGLLTLVLTYALARASSHRRATALYSVAITATCSLWVFNARLATEHALGFAAQAWVALAFAKLLVEDRGREPPPARAMYLAWAWFGIAGVVFSISQSGALLGVAPPALAAVITAAMRHVVGTQNRGRTAASTTAGVRTARLVRWLAIAAAVVITAKVAREVALDRAEFSVWLGGQPQGGAPPTFERAIQQVFHAFAPWSALLPLALVRYGLPPRSYINHEDPKTWYHSFFVLWVVLGYAATTVFSSRYGATTFLPVVALACLVGTFLSQWSDPSEGIAHRTSGSSGALVVLLLGGLIIRDMALFGDSWFAGLGVANSDLSSSTSTYGPSRVVLLALLLYTCVTAWTLFATASPASTKVCWQAPYRMLHAQWNRSFATRLWLVTCATLLVGVVLLAMVAIIAGPSGAVPTPRFARSLSSLHVRWLKRIAVGVLLLPALVAGVQWMRAAFARLQPVDGHDNPLHTYRVLPIIAAAWVASAAMSHDFTRVVTREFSFQSVYRFYREHATPDARLAHVRIPPQPARAYTDDPVLELASVDEASRVLAAPEPRWLVFRPSDLSALERAYRPLTGRHLPVVERSSRGAWLASNAPLTRTNLNPLAAAVLSAPPRITHPAYARFENGIEFLGYDLDLPHTRYVGPGESFVVTWYFRATRAALGEWKPFVHIDRASSRINGDHDPVDGWYPVRLWEAGDVIVDRQPLKVPSTFPTGPYTMYLGFFHGESRLRIVEGQRDKENRLIAGTLAIR